MVGRVVTVEFPLSLGALILAAVMVKALLITWAIRLLAPAVSFGDQIILVLISATTTGAFVLGAALVTARAHQDVRRDVAKVADKLDENEQAAASDRDLHRDE